MIRLSPLKRRLRIRRRQRVTCAAIASIAALVLPGLAAEARGNRPETPGTPATHPGPCSLGVAVAGFENSKSVSDGPKGPGPQKGKLSQRGRARA